MSAIHHILKSYWGYDQFRPQQQAIIEAVLEGKDALAILPTGGGKSICFQVPAMANEGICLVISPLIALMKDQVEGLRKKGITAFALHTGMNRSELIKTLELAGSSNCKFLYLSPERLESRLFLEYLPTLTINLIAVDEAHCISQWGYDFRPPYLRIDAFRQLIPKAPVLALTASATPMVQTDICEKLQIPSAYIFKQSFERPNLSYSVYEVEVKIKKLLEILKNVPGSAIVYCKSRKRTKAIAAELNSYGYSADFYHAGLSTEERNTKQAAWINNTTRIMVCTNAFGMGIDKSNVRVVVHYDLPDCLENYYQEAGRAGRDGLKAYAVALYQQKDITDLHNSIDLKFPDLATVQQIYQQLANYLQLPTGAGEGLYYPFDLTDFTTKFNANIITVINSLKVLEQAGYVSFNEQVFIPSRVEFVCDKNTLRDVEIQYPELEPLIKVLLRSYEGIFDQPTRINEKSVAFLLKQTREKVQEQLKTLHRYHIIQYQPQLDSPQLYFLSTRVSAEAVMMDQVQYEARKLNYQERLQYFLQYITEHNTCRSKSIAAYFGDENLKDCGICDTCLQKKKKLMTSADFQLLEQKIIALIKNAQNQSITIEQLTQQFAASTKADLWKVLDFLQAEHKITLDSNGKITWKG